jgi:hypothetical protein
MIAVNIVLLKLNMALGRILYIRKPFIRDDFGRYKEHSL